jgi:hypothetical protein
MVDALDRVFPQLPNAGAITGALYHELLALILILADPDKIKRHGEGQLSVQQMLDSADTRALSAPATDAPAQDAKGPVAPGPFSSRQHTTHSTPSNSRPAATARPGGSFYF